LSDYGSPPPPPPPPPGGFQVPPQGVAGGALANWGQRVGAYLVDYAVVLPFIFIEFLFLPKTLTTTVNGVVNTRTTGGNLGIAFLMGIIVFAIWLYNRWVLGGKGQSIGKKTLGLTLISEATGQPIGAGKAFLRDITHILDGFCLIGYLFPLWDAKRQTFADKLMTTVVITKA
jgi:uncharacterized RDD family membrane protein YckC